MHSDKCTQSLKFVLLQLSVKGPTREGLAAGEEKVQLDPTIHFHVTSMPWMVFYSQFHKCNS